MHNYRKVSQTPELPDDGSLRVTGQRKIKDVVTTMLAGLQGAERRVSILAYGREVSKAVSCAEIAKRRLAVSLTSRVDLPDNVWPKGKQYVANPTSCCPPAPSCAC